MSGFGFDFLLGGEDEKVSSNNEKENVTSDEFSKILEGEEEEEEVDDDDGMPDGLGMGDDDDGLPEGLGNASSLQGDEEDNELMNDMISETMKETKKEEESNVVKTIKDIIKIPLTRKRRTTGRKRKRKRENKKSKRRKLLLQKQQEQEEERRMIAQLEEGSEDMPSNDNPQISFTDDGIVVQGRRMMNHQEGDVGNMEEIVDEGVQHVTYQTYARLKGFGNNRRRKGMVFGSVYTSLQRKPWKEEEIDKFFTLLRMFGTQFEIICRFYPYRERNEIRTLYQKEERKNKARITWCLQNRIQADFEWLKQRNEEKEKVQEMYLVEKEDSLDNMQLEGEEDEVDIEERSKRVNFGGDDSQDGLNLDSSTLIHPPPAMNSSSSGSSRIFYGIQNETEERDLQKENPARFAFDDDEDELEEENEGEDEEENWESIRKEKNKGRRGGDEEGIPMALEKSKNKMEDEDVDELEDDVPFDMLSDMLPK